MYKAVLLSPSLKVSQPGCSICSGNTKERWKSSPIAACLCLEQSPSGCWLSLEAAALPGTALCMVWSVFLTRKIMRQWQILPAILCLENFSHGACRLNSRQKENELLIKICLDSLLCFLSPNLEDRGKKGFTAFPTSDPLFLMVVRQLAQPAFTFTCSLRTFSDCSYVCGYGRTLFL